MSMWKQHYFFKLDGGESKSCIAVDAYEIFLYNTDVSYLLLSEMRHMAMLCLN